MLNYFKSFFFSFALLFMGTNMGGVGSLERLEDSSDPLGPLILSLNESGSMACSGWHESRDFIKGYRSPNHCPYPFSSCILFMPDLVAMVRLILLHVATHHLNFVLICSTVNGKDG